MAKTISDEILKLSIIINGNSAQKQLYELEKATRDVKKQTEEYKQEQSELSKQGKKESQRYKELTALIKQNSATLEENKVKMDALQKEIGITGLTMAQLNSKAIALRATLKNLIPGSADHIRYTQELKEINTRMGELRGKSAVAKSSLSGLADGFNKYAALGASFIATLTGVVFSIQRVIDYNGKLSESMAGVRKTTGMTAKEVDELAKQLGTLRSRTSKVDLLGIAEQGGRIGIAKEEIFDFVKVMDMAAIALGDSFEGGPEVVAEKLGKIKGLFEETKNIGVEQAFNSIGSALNELGAAGLASEENLSDFATRIGAMPEALKPTIAETLGLGAAFEESGLKAEIAATNYSKVISIAARDFGNFAKVMGVSEQQIKDLINTNPTEFFLQFSDSLKNLNPTQLAQTLDYLKLNDNEVKMVLGTASKNVDLFREKIELAAVSLSDATSMQREFNIQNSTLQATLDKIKKTVTGWFSSETFTAWLTNSVTWLAKFIGATEDADGSVTGFRNALIFTIKIVAVLITSIVSYNTAIKLATIWTNGIYSSTALFNIALKANNVLLSLEKVLLIAYTSVMGLFGIATQTATTRLAALNAVTKLNPFGALVAVILAVVSAYTLFSESTSEAAKKQKILNEVANETQKTIRQEVDQLNLLLKIARDETASKQERLKAIEEINKISPEYLGNITLENINTERAVASTNAYIESLRKVAEQKAINNKLSELYSQRLEVENRVSNKEISFGEKLLNSFMSGGSDKFEKELNDKTISRIEEIEGINAQIETLLNKQRDNFSESAKVLSPFQQQLTEIDSRLNLLRARGQQATQAFKDLVAEREKLVKQNGGATANDPNFTPGKTAEKPKDYTNEIKQNNAEKLKAEFDYQESRWQLMDEGYDKEVFLQNNHHQRKLSELETQLTKEAEIEKALAKSKNNNISQQEREFWATWAAAKTQSNKTIHAQIEHENYVHQLKLNTIQEKYIKDTLQDDIEAYERAKTQRATEHNNQLAELGTNEEAKEKLIKEYNQRELDLEVAHLTKVADELKSVLQGENDGIDFSLLTPEQKETIIKQLDDLKLKIAELLAQKAKLQGATTGGIDLSLMSGVDILGFTPEQWDTTFSKLDSVAEKLKATEMVVTGLMNAYKIYNDFVNAGDDRRLKNLDKNYTAEQRKLKQKYDQGYLNKVQYERALQELEKNKEKNIAELEYKKAKRDRTMSLLGIATNTALGVMKAVAASPLTGGLPWSAIIAGMGALQAGLILAQPLPAKGYEQGLYPSYIKREQDGKVFNANYGGSTTSGMVSKPTYFLAGENGPEMIINKKDFKQLHPQLRNDLIHNIRVVRGYENGYYPTQTVAKTTTTSSSTATNSSDDLMKLALSIIQDNTKAINELREGYIQAVVSSRDLKSMAELREGIKKAEELRNKSKF